jgi:hypothetical protein
MYIIDYFRKIKALDAYREIEDVIRKYFMRFKFKRDDENNWKAFFLPGFANDEPFIYIKFLPYGGENIPCSIEIYQNVTIVYGPNGINCNPINRADFPLYREQFRLSEWKETKKKLIEAIEYALDSLNKTEYSLDVWKAEKSDPKTIVLEHTGTPSPVKKNRYKPRKAKITTSTGAKVTASTSDVSPVDYQGAKLP